MITPQAFLDIAAQALRNPRASRYVVTPLSERPLAYPLRTEGGAVPAMAMQFSVDHLRDPNIHRVITVAFTSEGYMLWCGDKFTQGDIGELEAGMRIGAAISNVPAAQAATAREAMLQTYGSYPYRAPCHFWKAWHSHQGVCKHVAAVLQHVERFFPGGVPVLLQQLSQHYHLMMHAPAALEGTHPGVDQVQLTRVLLPDVPGEIDAGSELSLCRPNGYLLWLKNGRTHLAQWDERHGTFYDMEGRLALSVIAAWAALPFSARSGR